MTDRSLVAVLAALIAAGMVALGIQMARLEARLSSFHPAWCCVTRSDGQSIKCRPCLEAPAAWTSDPIPTAAGEPGF